MTKTIKDEITYNDFSKIDIRIGTIIAVDDFPRAKKSAWKLAIHFGDTIGVKQSSAQITNYQRDELLGKNIVAVVNFPPRNIAGFMSEVLVLGTYGNDGNIHLIAPDSHPALQKGSQIL